MFGQVFKAKFIKLDREFALKRISKKDIQNSFMLSQLSNEIKERSWLVIKPNVDVLATDAKSLWKNLILDMGGDYRLWANAPSDPILN